LIPSPARRTIGTTGNRGTHSYPPCDAEIRRLGCWCGTARMAGW
jgi:hypothetical protein